MKKVYVLVDENNRVAGHRVFTDKATADFAKAGAMMFAPVGDTSSVYIMTLDLVEGDVEDFLALSGLGPKGRKAA